jgi:cell division transport system permease protein
MKIETLIRHFKEAYRGIRRNLAMSFASISAVAVTLFVFGIFLIVAFNMRYISGELEKQVAITASLQEGTTQAQMQDLLSQIKSDPMQKDATFVSKEQGLKEMKEQWGETDFIQDLSEDGKSNPLPDVIRVQPQSAEKIDQLAKKIEQLPNIESVDYGEGVTERLLSFSGWVGNLVLLFGLILSATAAFLISNTIKLTIMNRQREIEIMRLVGASNWFIRWPFFFEGAFIGVVGAVFPIAFCLAMYQAVLSVLNAGETFGILKLMPMMSLAAYVGGSVLVLGILIGVFGSIISVRRFLKI